MRDPLGRSLHDKASETRQMAESDRPTHQEKAGPYVLVVAILFVLIVVLIIATR